MMWKPVMAGKATFSEVAYQWTLDDLCTCLEVMDIQQALEEDAAKRVNKN